MQYLLLIYENEANRQSVDRSKMMEEYGKFTQSIIESGNFKAGDALQPTSTATTVRVKDGKPMSTHGPFAETREALMGYYLIDAKDLDQALGIAGPRAVGKDRLDRGASDHGVQLAPAWRRQRCA